MEKHDLKFTQHDPNSGCALEVEHAANLEHTLAPPRFFKRLEFQPYVHGLRAIAVVSVVFFHFDLGLTGGFVGVDVFFVISGYLISRIIWHEIEDETFSVVGFWNRRVHRLQPALLVMVVVVITCQLMMQQSWCQTSAAYEEGIYVLLSAANFKYYTVDTYFENPESHIFLHCWSLSVEEQFYALYPLFSVMCANVMRRLFVSPKLQMSLVFAACFVILCSSLTIGIVSVGNNFNFGFYMLPARAWEMLLGVLVAFPCMPFKVPCGLINRQHAINAFHGCGCAVQANLVQLWGSMSIIVAIVSYDSQTPYPSYYALLPCLGTAAVILGHRLSPSEPASELLLSRFLSSRVLVYVGEISYSVYLWHWPLLIIFLRCSQGRLEIMHKVLGVFLSGALGAFSSTYIETPFRKATRASEKRFWAAILTTWMALLLYLGLSINVMATGGDCNGTNALTTASLDLTFKMDPSAQKCIPLDMKTSVEWDSVSLQAISSSPYRYTPESQLMFSAEPDWLYPYYISPQDDRSLEQSPSLVMIGSSHCMMLNEIVRSLLTMMQKRGASLCVHRGAIKFHGFEKDTQQRTFDKQRLSFLSEWKPEVIVWADMWSHYVAQEVAESSLSWKDGSFEFLEYSFRLLMNHTRRLVIWGDNPKIAGGHLFSFTKVVLAKYRRQGSFDFLRDVRPNKARELQRIIVETHIQEVVERIKRSLDSKTVEFVPIAPLFQDNQSVLVVDPMTYQLMYADRDHLNSVGTRRLAALFAVSVFQQPACSTYT